MIITYLNIFYEYGLIHKFYIAKSRIFQILNIGSYISLIYIIAALCVINISINISVLNMIILSIKIS